MPLFKSLTAWYAIKIIRGLGARQLLVYLITRDAVTYAKCILLYKKSWLKWQGFGKR